jgi:hypothetical protein
MEDLKKNCFNDALLHIQTLLHGKMGDVCRADAAVAILLTGYADKGLNRVGNNPVEIEADFGGVNSDGIVHNQICSITNVKNRGYEARHVSLAAF